MDILLFLKAALLGVIEGLTEFLPISSTGHLILAGSLLDVIGAKAKVFYIAIQLGAILAIVWVYRQRFLDAARGLRDDPPSQRFAANLAVGVLPALVLGFFFGSAIKSLLFNPISVAIALVVGGFIILWAERRAHTVRIETVDALRWRDALKIGLAQCVAMIPGTSRSGATIIGGLLFGLSRKAATEFSFFLAVPTMLAATTYDVVKNYRLFVVTDLPWFSIGFACAFVAAMLTVRALMRFISTHGFTVFAWYRIAFGLIVLATAEFGLIDWQPV